MGASQLRRSRNRQASRSATTGKEQESDAEDLRDELVNDITKTHARSVRGGDLCDYFQEHYLKPAQYVDGRKVAGVRSLMTPIGQLKVLRDYFGERRLRSITHGKSGFADGKYASHAKAPGLVRIKIKIDTL